MASGSNAPFITNALVAWPPPPSSARFGAASPPGTARNTRFSLAAHFIPPPIPATSPPTSSTSTFPGASPLNGYGVPRQSPDTSVPASASGSASGSSGSSTPARSPSVKQKPTHPQRTRGSSSAHETRRDYPPPKAPLSPSQLGRIAQSFGIAVPRIGGDGVLPYPASSPKSSYNSPRSPAPTAGSDVASFAHHASPNHVIAVIPPTSLLTHVPDQDPEAEQLRRRRWRRGRLIPLQPTLGAMLVAIAREFGLPSTIGIKVYLNGTGSRRGSTSSLDDDMGGPEITPTTWTSLFAHSARQPMSPGATPVSTPRKRNQYAGFGSSAPPESLRQQDRVKSLSQSTDAGPSRSVSSASASSFSPPTPASFGAFSSMPMFGTIEFDIDPTQARWLDGWLEAGGPSRRLGPGAEIMAVRELTLVERLKDPRPKFLRQIEEDRERTERLAAERASTEALEASRLAAEREEAEREAEQLRREIEEAELQAARLNAERAELAETVVQLPETVTDREVDVKKADKPEEEPTERDLPSLPISAPFGNGTLIDSPIVEEPSPSRTPPPPVETSFVSVMPPSPSGIMLSPTSATSSEYRASGMIMADQLNTLEKMVRDLSPKDIRFTSRGKMGGLTASPPVKMADLPSRGSSRLPYLRNSASHNSADSAGSSPSPTGVAPPTQWPAVPFKSADSPRSPGLNEYFHQRVGPPLSHEMAARVQSAESANRATLYGGATLPSGERPKSGPPKRPVRPPTPDLTMPETLPHVLPLELLKHTSPTLPSTATFGNRPTSMSLKNMARRASHKALRPKERAHAYAVANTRGEYVPPPPPPPPHHHHPRQESSTSYTSYTSSQSRGQSIGSIDEAQQIYQPFPRGDELSPDSDAYSPNAPHRKDGSFTSRFFSFGGRKAREAEERPMTIVHISSPIATSVKHVQVTPAELAASNAAAGVGSGLPIPASAVPSTLSPQSLASPASMGPNAGVLGFSTPNPSTSTLGPNDPRPSGEGHRGSMPSSPTSLRHVKRKPVPGMEGEADSGEGSLA